MSSFKRKGALKQVSALPGTRISPASPSTCITSTGIPSLDDILGGGLPLSCSLLIAAPDLHSSYGDLVQKYFIAQGLRCHQNVCVVTDDAEQFVKDVMWIPRRGDGVGLSTSSEDGGSLNGLESSKIKIAWRYEQMKQFQTTIPSSSHLNGEFCHEFDLTSRIPDSVIDDALMAKQLCLISPGYSSQERAPTSQVLKDIANLLEAGQSSPIPVRICIPSLGSPDWGELADQDILCFLHLLRSLLRRYPNACASVSLPPHLSADSWGDAGWISKLSWLSDAAFTLSAFTGNPSLASMFPSYHGVLQVHSLPAPHSLLPPSDKFSILRGLAASGASSGENNLTFKCTRKRLMFETLHLDIEGGVGERRTGPSSIGLSSEVALAAVEVALEEEEKEEKIGTEYKAKKGRKKVAFRSDRPDLYDF